MKYPDVSILRRLLFVASVVSHKTPDYWNIITKFSVNKSSEGAVLLPKQARLAVQNITFLDKEALLTDDELFRELAMTPFKGRESVGIVLISKKTVLYEVCRKLIFVQRQTKSDNTIH